MDLPLSKFLTGAVQKFKQMAESSSAELTKSLVSFMGDISCIKREIMSILTIYNVPTIHTAFVASLTQ